MDRPFPLATDITTDNRLTGWYILNDEKRYWLPSKQWRPEMDGYPQTMLQ